MSSVDSSGLVGQVAAGYRVIAAIGSGTMGHVYEAEDSVGRRVALKVLHKRHQKELAPRFLREGKTLALLSHPNIVQLVDMGQLASGELYLATERVPGGSLRQLMDRGPIEPRRALWIIRQLLDALDAAHGLGVVHRDIKPENIMVTPAEQADFVKVLDFGVAKLLQDTVAGLGEANLTTVGFSVFGSALYIAPESATGQPVDARLDLYSVGAMFYEMVTGRPPFDHEDPAVLLRMQAFDPPPTLQQGAPEQAFTPELEQLVAKALVKQPADRYASAADMIAAVDVALMSVDPAAAPVPAPQAWRQLSEPIAIPRPTIDLEDQRARTAPVRMPRRYKLVIAAAAAVAVIGVSVLVVSTMSRRAAAVASSELATQASELVKAGKHREAADLVERQLGGAPSDGSSFLVLGHARYALGDRVEALAAYERALHLAPELGGDAQLRANLVDAVAGRDSLTVVIALELMASLTPPAHDALIAYASTGKLVDGRRRAMMLAERERVADRVDRIESWSLDLQQLASCDERKRIIAKLVATADRRSVAVLDRAKRVKCLERDAADALAKLGAPQ